MYDENRRRQTKFDGIPCGKSCVSYGQGLRKVG
jgi:hypothetical protein